MSDLSPVGQRLKAERERKSIPYVDVARATGVYIHHLAALEFGRFDELGNDDAVDRSIRAYAEYLGWDGAALVAESRRERGLPEAEITPPARTITARGKAPSRWVVAPMLVALIAVAVWWAMRPGPERTASPEPAPPPSPAHVEPAIEREPAIQEAPPVAPAPAVDGAFAVPEHGVGRGVQENRLVGEGDRFEEGSVVWFWTLVTGGSPGDTVRHVWLRDGRVVQTISLRLGASRWRTHSSKSLPPGSAGAWAVEARDDEGNLLARDTFVCSP